MQLNQWEFSSLRIISKFTILTYEIYHIKADFEEKTANFAKK